jgi:hypothetical protein
MRYLFTVLVAFFAFSGVALASDPFANYYENTVTVTNASGARTVLINADGSYSQTLPDGTTANGTWKLDGDKGCFMSGAEGAEPYCVPADAHAVGDTWELTAPDGTKETATLTAGR